MLRCRENLPLGPLSRLARMARLPASLLALALGAALTFLLVSCGGEDARLLPGETAREITANLDTVQQLSDEGDCAGAESAALQVGEQIEALEGVDAKLKRSLEEGAARLNEVIDGCEESTPESLAPAVTPSEAESSDEALPEDKGKEKEEKKEEKEEGEPEEKAPAPEPSTPGPALPAQANGEGKGIEKGGGPPAGEEEEAVESPSGGVGPGSAVGSGE
jgi:hypothetical protein